MKMEEAKRQLAIKAQIKDIVDGEYVKQEGWNPNYILNNNIKISRVNLISTIISKNPELNKLTLDDGTGSVSLRSFEDIDLETVDVGDTILVIGRPREYNNEKYIMPEIIKKIKDKKWIEVRKKEIILDKIKNKPDSLANNLTEEENKVDEETQEKTKKDKITIQENNNDQIVDEKDIDIYQKIINTIKEFDKGKGADFDEVLEQIKEKDSEDIINTLIEQGEIFEIKPGKLKILE